MADKQTAIISSTARDLPEYRDEVMHGCLRLDVFPKMMEHLPALDAEAIAVSLALVDKADIYIGIFAHHYGYVPKENNPKQISITEMEYDRAVERKIPRLIFLMDENHPVKPADVDKGATAEKLEVFKRRLNTERVRDTFTTKEDLRGKLIHALSELRKERETGEKVALGFHPPNIIPKAPEPYIAHPYSLLQTKDVVGRQAELNLLTDWVTTNKQVPADTRIFNLVAIGGMGKSALTWKWFNDIAPNELPKLAGRMWWSFYESDAHYENFIIRALAYVSGQSEKAVREMKSPDREDQLWRILDQQPFLLVLDGLERILLAYARMDAAHLPDDDLDEQTVNRVAKAHGLPECAGESFIGKHGLRRTADHRAGQFLRRLARVKQSRILITTRLYLAELQTDAGEATPGCFASFLTGLKDDDALNLWREFKVSGSREQIIPVFNSVQNYPLLIRALAGEVAAFRPAPGNFDVWCQAYPLFNPASLALSNARTHVLEFALRGLTEGQRRVLHVLASFRMPATWETLRALLIENDAARSAKKKHRLNASSARRKEVELDKGEVRPPKPCPDDRALDGVLTDLEDRGLVGWDKQSNRYDLHPIVRTLVWHAVSDSARHGIDQQILTYFDAVPKPTDWSNLDSVEERTAAFELYYCYIRLGRPDDAYTLFRDCIQGAVYYRFNASRDHVALLRELFPQGIGQLPSLRDAEDQRDAIHSLAIALYFSGDLSQSIAHFQRVVAFAEKQPRHNEFSRTFSVVAHPLRHLGKLRDGEGLTKAGLAVSRASAWHRQEEFELQCLAFLFAFRGRSTDAELAVRRAQKIGESAPDKRLLGKNYSIYAQCLLLNEQYLPAAQNAQKA